MSKRYDTNDGIRFTVQFTDAIVGNEVDPTTVKFFIKRPDNVEVIYLYPNGLERVSQGNYYKDLVVTQSGIYYFRWQGEGAFPSAYEGYFVVKDSQFD